MKYFLFILTVILAINCKGTDRPKDVLVNDMIVELYEYNKTFYDENYTGTVNGYFDEEKRHIEFISYYKNGEIEKYESFHKNGDIKLSIDLKYNSIHGVQLYYLPGNELAYKVEYELGRKNGLAKSYYSNGQVQRQISFENDLKNGKQFEFSESGDTLLVATFKNGEQIE